MGKIRIAICGGGIASMCLAHVLCRLSDFEVKIFEGSPTFREEGAAVGLGSNAQEALALISVELRQALSAAGGVRMSPSTRLMMGTGPNSGSHIGDINPEVAQIVVHRGTLLRKLRSLLPPDLVQMGKKITKYDLDSGSVVLSFEDGTHYAADAVVGCDGINSITRRAILGEDHPAASPVNSSGYNHRVVVPLDTAISAFGKDYCDFKTQHGWVGEDGFLLTDHVDDGTSMQVIAGWAPRPWPYEASYSEWPKEQLKKDLEGWGDIGKAMEQIFTAQPKLYAARGRTHLDTPTYCKGRMCIAGDAAQTFPPFLGAGVGQAVEDILVLSTVLSACTNRADIERAFKIYDKLRRPRRTEVAHLSRNAALILTGRHPDMGLDMKAIAAMLPDWGRNVSDYDVRALQETARREMHESQES